MSLFLFVSQMKPNDSRKRPSIRAQGLGKVAKQVYRGLSLCACLVKASDRMRIMGL